MTELNRVEGGQGTPIVSIGLPVYNGSDFLEDTIVSILAQDFGYFELIIADNASTDKTREICQKYAACDGRIKYVRHPSNMGAAKNYNFVFHCASGKYFKWAAHDDLLGPRFLSNCLNAFEAYSSSPVLVYPNFEFIDEGGQVINIESPFVNTSSRYPPKRIIQTLRSLGMVNSIFGLFDRDALARTRLIGSFISSDYVLLMETAMLGNILKLDGEPQFQRRVHKKMSRKANKTDKAVMQWFDPEVPVDSRPKRRLEREYLRSIYSIDGLSQVQRFLCAALVGGWIFARRIRRR